MLFLFVDDSQESDLESESSESLEDSDINDEYKLSMCLCSRRTLTMFVEVVALRYVVLITECHNSYKHSQSP